MKLGLPLLLIAVEGLLACGCSKPQAPEADVRSIRFMAASTSMTKSYYNGGTLGGDPIFVSGTHINGGVASDIMSGKKFTINSSVYNAESPAVYWPIGGKVDFLAWAGVSNPASLPSGFTSVAWDPTHSAYGATFRFSNSKSAATDLVWAVANDKTMDSSPVTLNFNHAMARLEVHLLATNLDGKLKLKSVVLQNSVDDKLCLAGTFTLDNTKNIPEATWSDLSSISDCSFFTGQNIGVSASGLASLDGLLDGSARNALSSMDVTLASMFVPEQPTKNLFITYSLNGGLDEVVTVNLARGIWEKGHVYIFRLKFDGPGLEVIYYEGFDDEVPWQ